MVNIQNLYFNKIKIDEKLYINIRIYYIGYVTVKDLRYVKVNNVKPLYLIINKINGHFEGSNGSKYLTLVPTDQSKDTLKTYEEQWTKIRDLISSKTNDSDNYDEKYENQI